jgi:dihydrofolate reductase
MNGYPKYVASTMLKDPAWNNSRLIQGNVREGVAKLKQEEGKDILLYGSAALTNSLLRGGLIDEYRLLVYSLILGSGKELFSDDSKANLQLVDTSVCFRRRSSNISPSPRREMMGKIIANISMSLDGCITGPNDSVELGLGEGGERLHEWGVRLSSWRERHGMPGGETDHDSEVMAETFANVGAFVMGRRMFDHGEAPWGDDPPFRVPVFVVTHRPREVLSKKGGTTFIFVTDGIESAFRQAQAAAGDKDVAVSGGADVIQQAIKAGLLDELQVHLVPIILGDGRKLFDHLVPTTEFEVIRVIDSPAVTHLTFQVVK